KSAEKNGTNSVPEVASAKPLEGTNASASVGTKKMGTNAVLLAGTNKPSTNPAAQMASRRGMGPGGGPDGPNKAPEVSPLIKARIDRITQSEILGQVIRPMPMALLYCRRSGLLARNQWANRAGKGRR